MAPNPCAIAAWFCMMELRDRKGVLDGLDGDICQEIEQAFEKHIERAFWKGKTEYAPVG